MIAVIALLLMQPASTTPKVYFDADGFLVGSAKGSCIITSEYESGISTNVYVNAENEAYFKLSQQNWKPVAGKRYNFTVDFGDVYYELKATAFEDVGFIASLHPNFLESYATASGVEISWGNKSIASLNLKGSSKAIAAIRMCMKDNGLTLTAPPAQVSIPPKVKSDPFDLSAPAKLRNYMGDGYPVEADGAEGVVKAAVKVSSKGRALECNVLETSGSIVLDEAACKAFKQSGFHAAKDRAGQPIESVIELPIRFEDPSKTVEPN